MCTSFVDRRDDLIIAMNFDNNGMNFNLNEKNPEIFSIDVKTNRGNMISFGVNKEGTFINDLACDSNGKGAYKRVSRNRTLTTYLVKNLLERKIPHEELENYLEEVEIVNAPNLSTHNLIITPTGNVYVIEPGRGIMRSKKDEEPYVIMTNFSLIDFKKGHDYIDSGFNRYQIAKNELEKTDEMTVEKAFGILEKTKQDGDYKTEFSMVYSQETQTIYYCFDSNFSDIKVFKFE